MARRGGSIVKFNQERGFGFIAPDSGTGDLFFHISAVRGDRNGITAGETIRYEIALSADGRFQAKRVWRSAGKSLEGGVLVAATLAFWFLAGIAVLGFTGRTSFWPTGYYVVMSIISVTLYAGDKRNASAGARRTPESTLHLWDFLGGWPGAIIALQVLRHKRRKAGFVVTTAAIACAHVLGWVLFVLAWQDVQLRLS